MELGLIMGKLYTRINLHEILVYHTRHGFHMVFETGFHLLNSIEELDVCSSGHVLDCLS